ncbi:MAG: BREX system ATP-binding domain-containing protein, partial [Nitrolancea sp.]
MYDLSQRHTARQIPLLVGREREQATLRRALDDMLAGHGSLVLVSGEAGIGKTTLVEWLANEAEGAGCLVLRGGCYDLSVTPPYGPWAEALASYSPRDLLPPLPSFVGDLEALSVLGSQERLFAETRDFFHAVAREQPLVLILEDLHWADQSSLDFLRVLDRRLNDHRILIGVTYRSEEMDRHHPLYSLLPMLIRETRSERVEVRPLDDSAHRALIQQRYVLSKSDQERLETYLRERGEGNPLYALELLRSLEGLGALAPQSKGWVLRDLTTMRLPTLLQQLIDSRLARLGQETRTLLQVAAIIGQEVPFDLWQQVSGASDEAQITAIEQGQTAQLLEEVGAAGKYRFRHALFRETLYDEVILIRRRFWHRAVADVLVTQPNPDPDIVAYHLQKAVDHRAVEWLIQAGERAQRSYVWVAAAERFETALKLLPEDATLTRERAWLLFRIGLLIRHAHFDQSIAQLEEAARLAAIASDCVLEALAYAHAGLVRVFNGDGQRGLHEVETGVLALEDLDEAQRYELKQIEDVLGETIGIQGWGTLILQLEEQGYFLRAEQLLSDRRDRGPVDAADAHRAAGGIHAYLGRPELAHQEFTKARLQYQALRDPSQAGTDAAWEYIFVQVRYGTDHLARRHELAQIARTLWSDGAGLVVPTGDTEVIQALEFVLSGDWEPAIDALDRYIALSPILFTPFHTSRLMLARYCGDRELVWSEIRRVMPAGPVTEFGDHRYWVLDDLMRLAGAQALDDGDLILARSWLEAHDRLLAWSGAVLGQAENALSWSRYHALTGDLANARASAEQASVHASDPRQPLALIAVHRFLGNLD